MGRLEYALKLWYIYNGDGDMKKNGFTLTEILVVLALIGLLLVIVVPRISNSLTRRRVRRCWANVFRRYV